MNEVIMTDLIAWIGLGYLMAAGSGCLLYCYRVSGV